mgnify:CR=1 FL=1
MEACDVDITKMEESFNRLGNYDLIRTVNLINLYIRACKKVKEKFLSEILRRYEKGEIKDLSALDYADRNVIISYIKRKNAQVKSSLDGWINR